MKLQTQKHLGQGVFGFVAPQLGLEPRTIALTGRRSTIELLRNSFTNGYSIADKQAIFQMVSS